MEFEVESSGSLVKFGEIDQVLGCFVAVCLNVG
jgi:hypothetical protein